MFDCCPVLLPFESCRPLRRRRHQSPSQNGLFKASLSPRRANEAIESDIFGGFGRTRSPFISSAMELTMTSDVVSSLVYTFYRIRWTLPSVRAVQMSRRRSLHFNPVLVRRSCRLSRRVIRQRRHYSDSYSYSSYSFFSGTTKIYVSALLVRSLSSHPSTYKTSKCLCLALPIHSPPVPFVFLSGQIMIDKVRGGRVGTQSPWCISSSNEMLTRQYRVFIYVRGQSYPRSSPLQREMRFWTLLQVFPVDIYCEDAKVRHRWLWTETHCNWDDIVSPSNYVSRFCVRHQWEFVRRSIFEIGDTQARTSCNFHR